jgi:alpha/beta superfamily hydrolase
MRFLLLVMICFLQMHLQSQTINYLDTTFNYRIEKNIEFARDTNYAGRLEVLTLDLYKPINDQNKFRPLLVLIHGGAWAFGSKDDADISTVAKYMAKRGYVVASINYRKGMHINASVPNPVFRDQNPLNPNDENSTQCQYPSDTAEVIRANYRGMQDAKSAIRWLKARNVQDSSCIANVYVGGSSAGGFIAYAVAFMDLPNEKPIQTNALSLAPVPEPKLVFCHKLNNPVSTIIDRSRPDLGSIEGRTNLNGQNARVKGLISIFGGLIENQIGTSLIQGIDTPAVFMYHQECDIVVPFNRASGNSFFSNLCIPLLGSVPPYFPTYTPISNIPIFLGSNYLNTYFNSINASQRPKVKFSPVLNGAPTAFSCLANPPCHSLPYILAYTDTIANFLKPIVDATNANTANNCPINVSTSTNNAQLNNQVNVYPNPFGTLLNVELPSNLNSISYALFSNTGKLIISKQMININGLFQIQLSNKLTQGIYYLQIKTKKGVITKKLLH